MHFLIRRGEGGPVQSELFRAIPCYFSLIPGPRTCLRQSGDRGSLLLFVPRKAGATGASNMTRKQLWAVEISCRGDLFIKSGTRRLDKRTQPVDMLPESLVLMNLFMGFDRFVLAHPHDRFAIQAAVHASADHAGRQLGRRIAPLRFD